MMAITELGHLEGFRVGAVGPLFITVFHELATLERLRLLEALQRQVLTAHPKVFTLTVIVGSSITPPGPEVREFAASLQKQFDGTTAASATVLAARGLGAVIARGFLAGLALITAGAKPTQVFKTVEDAVRWLLALPELPEELSGAVDLVADVERFIAGTT